MTLSRRLFLGGLLAAPAIVRSGVLMPIKPPIVAPKLYAGELGSYLDARFIEACTIAADRAPGAVAIGADCQFYDGQQWANEQTGKAAAMRPLPLILVNAGMRLDEFTKLYPNP